MEATLSPPIDDVAEVARGRLCNSPYMAIRTVSCDYENGILWPGSLVGNSLAVGF